MMLILTAFSLTLVTLIKATMIIFGAGLALFLFSSIFIFAVYNLFAEIFSSRTGVLHV